MFKKADTKLSIEVLEKCAPITIIEKDALAKMKVYVDECDDEIGWLGTANKEEGFFHITDVMLFEQEVHSTTTEITPEGLSEFGEKLLQQENGMDIWNSMKVWGHSHVNMSVSPSGQDNNQMEVFADNGHDFSIRIIANKKGDMALDLYDYETGVIYKNIQWYASKTETEISIQEEINKLEDRIESLYLFLEEVDDKRINEIEENIKSEMKLKVSKKTYGTTANSNWQDNWKKGTYYDTTKKKEEEKETKESENEVTYLNYNNETGEYSYTSFNNFETYGIDSYTLMELAMALDIDDGIEILEMAGYINHIDEDDLAKLLNNVKNDDYYSYYGTQFFDEGGLQ